MQRDPSTHAIIGAAMQVHRELGPGFLEGVYHEALRIEFEEAAIPFLSQVQIRMMYRGRRLESTYRADFVCFTTIVVELKAQKQLSNVDHAQVIHYLKASGHSVGLLINFGAQSLEYLRFNPQPRSM
jgi:GxxExxY protein